MRFIRTVAAAALPIVAAMSIAPATAQLSPGTRAPDFTTRGAIAGKPFTLNLRSQLRRGPVVLYFFPAAFTDGCNAEAKMFAESIDQFRAAGATDIGMSADPVGRLRAFSTEHCAGRFAVASATPQIIRGFDVDLGRTVPGADGKPRAITSRTSYVIARDGRIAYAHSDMNPADHVRNTLAAVRALR